MKGDLAFLDGLLVTNSCDHIRRLFDVFTAKEVAPFNHYLDVPHLNSEESFARLTAQLRGLQAKLESFFGVTVSREALSDAIKLYNRTRLLLGRASALRGEDPPRATGSEMLALSIASASVPKDRFNPLRRAASRRARTSRSRSREHRRRVCWCSAERSTTQASSSIIESMGASIVADQLCWGSKSFADLADEEIDPIDAIARRILEHMPCPRMLDQYPKRLANLLEAVKQYRVDGIICERLKFCDLWGGEIEMLRRSLKQEAGIPVLVLERDYATAGGVLGSYARGSRHSSRRSPEQAPHRSIEQQGGL